MAERVDTLEILQVIWRECTLEMDRTPIYEAIDQLDRFIGNLEHNITVVFDRSSDAAYTTVTGEKDTNRRLIKIGGKLVQRILKLPSTLTQEEAEKVIRPATLIIFGLNYHEMGHNMVTDMVSRDIIDYPKEELRDFMHKVFNTEEDYVCEEAADKKVRRDLPDFIPPKVFFDFIIESLFREDAETYKDTGDVNSFLYYLLLILRVGKDAIKGENAVFEKYKDEIIPRMTDILTEENPTERLHKVVTFCEWMVENIEEFDFSEVEDMDDDEKLSGSMPKGFEPMEGMEGIGGPESDEISDEERAKAREEAMKEAERRMKAWDELSDEEKEAKEKADAEMAVRDAKDKERADAEFADPVLGVDMRGKFDDMYVDGEDHTWVYAKDEFVVKDSSVYKDIDDILYDMDGAVHEVEASIKLCEARKAPRYVGGFKRGKLDTRTAIQKTMRRDPSLDIYERKEARGKKKSVAVGCIGDNSGSMGGIQSEICTAGMLTLAEVCDATKTPAQFTCFTRVDDCSKGGNITIIQKDYDEKLSDTKQWFAINSSSLIRKLSPLVPVHTFRGNQEENCIPHVAQRLAERPEEIKLLFVFCDGATTGSRSRLQRNIANIEASGIHVIGVGVKTDISHIYPESRTFNSNQDLQENLGNYLATKISEYILK